MIIWLREKQINDQILDYLGFVWTCSLHSWVKTNCVSQEDRDPLFGRGIASGFSY